MEQFNPNSTPEDVLWLMAKEHERSCTLHLQKFGNPMEAYGVITEEYHEVVEAFRCSKDKYPLGNFKLRTELIQLGAMCRKAMDTATGFTKLEGGNIEHFDKQLPKYEAVQTLTTMEALGLVTFDYKNFGDKITLFYKGHSSEQVKMASVYSALVNLGISCRDAFLSCCCNRKEEV